MTVPVLEESSRPRAQDARQIPLQGPVRLVQRQPHLFDLPAPAGFDPQSDVQAILFVEEVLLAGDVDVEVSDPAVKVFQPGEIVAEKTAPERLTRPRPHGGAQVGIGERFLLRMHEADPLHLGLLAVEVARIDLPAGGLGRKPTQQDQSGGEEGERHQNCFFNPRPTP